MAGMTMPFARPQTRLRRGAGLGPPLARKVARSRVCVRPERVCGQRPCERHRGLGWSCEFDQKAISARTDFFPLDSLLSEIASGPVIADGGRFDGAAIKRHAICGGFIGKLGQLNCAMGGQAHFNSPSVRPEGRDKCLIIWQSAKKRFGLQTERLIHGLGCDLKHGFIRRGRVGGAHLGNDGVPVLEHFCDLVGGHFVSPVSAPSLAHGLNHITSIKTSQALFSTFDCAEQQWRQD